MKAILKTAIPASAVRLAAGSLTPRFRNAPAIAEAQGRELDQLAFAQLRVRVDDGLAPPGVFAALLENRADGLQGRGNRVDRRCAVRRAGDSADQELLQSARAPEQDLALVGEVPEERPLGEPGQRGTLDDLDVLRSAAAASDGVIHLAFKHDIAFTGDFQGAADADRRAVETFGDVLAGTDRPLVIASGTAGIAPGQVATERDGPVPPRRTVGGGPETRRGTAELTLTLADRGVRSVVLASADGTRRRGQRVHGDHRRHRPREGRGRLHRRRGEPRPAVHRLDAAHLFRLAVRRRRRDRRCTRSPTKACRSATSPG